jgi:hypothetical protein
MHGGEMESSFKAPYAALTVLCEAYEEGSYRSLLNAPKPVVDASIIRHSDSTAVLLTHNNYGGPEADSNTGSNYDGKLCLRYGYNALTPARFPRDDFPYLSPTFELTFTLLEGNEEVEVRVALSFLSNPPDRSDHDGGSGVSQNEEVLDWLARSTQ